MRFNHRREYYTPQGAQLQDAKGTDAAIYFYEQAGRIYSIGFHGKAQKPDFHHNWRSPADRQRHADSFIAGRQRRAEYRAELRAQDRKPHTLEPGRILRSSWGYEQTNVNFYIVTRVVGPHTVELQEIGLSTVPDKETGSSMADYVVADPETSRGEILKRRANAGNCVRIDDVKTASPWEGRPCYRSWYA